MAQPIIFKITEAGKLAALNAGTTSPQIKINLTQVAVATAKRTITGSETALIAEAKRFSIISGDVHVSSNTLRFTGSMNVSQITPIYQVGLFTDDGVLFAIAASNTIPLFNLHPDITFVIGFGLSLNDVAAGSVSVTTDPSGTLSVVIMEQHLAAPDPHPQYLNVSRFQLLLQTLIPLGYQYTTHVPVNPKPAFDELMGIDTQWRRIAGKIMVSTDPNDNYIKDVGLVLGQRGMTELANQQRPSVYPLQTTHLFERYDPSQIIETVWMVVSNKSSVDEGAGVSFIVSANNIPDGQILSWSVKEGMLNASSNNVANPEKEQSGTAILRNGQITIEYQTVADDNIVESQKHVRLTVGAPASLSINVPVRDLGRNEKVIHITDSTTSGLSLDEYYKKSSGAYPVANDKIRFIVDAGVDIVAPNISTPAIVDGTNWPAGSNAIVENRGRILGYGGDGGTPARYSQKSNSENANNNTAKYKYSLTTPSTAGGNGGTAIKGSLIVDNYGLIAGGGGGGGGAGIFYATQSGFGDTLIIDGVQKKIYVGGGGGSGGGAPFGARYPNPYTVTEFLEKFNNTNISVPYENLGKYLSAVLMRDTAEGASHAVYGQISLGNTLRVDLPSVVTSIQNYSHFKGERWVDGEKDYYYTQNDLEGIRLQPKNATLNVGGAYGYDITEFGRYTNNAGADKYVSMADVMLNHGGAGGDIGEKGGDGVIGRIYGFDGETISEVLKQLPPSKGGLAGFVKEDAVTITNFDSGITKGR